MKGHSKFGILAVCVLGMAIPAGAITITFEEGLGNDAGQINVQYTGVTFTGATTGESWLFADATSDNYNASSWPSGQEWGGGFYWMNDYVGAWTAESGGDGKIMFDAADATYVQLNYCSAGPFHLEAYDAGDNLLDTAMGSANRRYLEGNESGPSTLRVDAPSGQSIAYVMVHDTGNYWVVDNVATDATGIGVIPEPLTLLGLGLAVAGVGRYLRRRRFAC